MNTNPMRSICNSFSLIVASAGLIPCGTWRDQKIAIAATAPQGRLIKKLFMWTYVSQDFRNCRGKGCSQSYHQRHVTLSAKAPPIRGPITEAMAYAEPKRPVKAGRFFSGAEIPIIIYDPAKDPATPKPVMARPTINVVLFRATPGP